MELEARGKEIMLALAEFAAKLKQDVVFPACVIPVSCPEQGIADDCGIDCGLFTAGFAAAIMLGLNVSSIVQSKMPRFRQQWPKQLKRAGNSGIREVFSANMLGA